MITPVDADAIPTDVSGEQEPPAITEPEHQEQAAGQPAEPEERPLSPREEAMNRIVEMQEQSLEEEVLASASQEIPAEVEERSAEPDALKIKVDGVETEIPIDQAKAVIQKNLAADKRLNDATLKQKQLNDWEQQLVQREQALQALPTTDGTATDGTATTGEPAQEDTKELIQTAVDKLYDGDTDEAVDALSKVMEGRSNATPIDPEQIVQQAVSAMTHQARKQEYQNDVTQGKQKFAKEFKDIADDPILFSVADDLTLQLIPQHPDWTPTQVIMEAGRQTREWADKLRGAGGGSSSRAERKAQLQSLPRSNGSMAYQPPKPDNGPKTSVEIIKQMKEQRGQA